MLTHDVRMRLTPRLRELGVLPQIIYHQPLSTLDAGASVPTNRP
jgi:hypothetical protein